MPIDPPRSGLVSRRTIGILFSIARMTRAHLRVISEREALEEQYPDEQTTPPHIDKLLGELADDETDLSARIHDALTSLTEERPEWDIPQARPQARPQSWRR
jgi:hypothetical protein